MGLAERRRIADIKENKLPKFQEQLNEACGFDLPFEFKIDSLPEDTTVLDCFDFYIDSLGPGLVVSLMRELCKDAIGKKAAKAAIKKVVFVNTAKSPEDKGEKSFSLKDGTLKISCSFYGYSDLLYSQEELLPLVEALL